MVTVASSEYLADKPRSVKPKDIFAHHLIGYRQLSSGRIVDWQFKSKEGSFSLPPKGRLIFSNIEAVTHCVKLGLGIGHIGLWHVKDELQSGHVVELLKKYRTSPLDVKIYFSSRSQRAKKIRVFIDFIFEKVAQQHFD